MGMEALRGDRRAGVGLIAVRLLSAAVRRRNRALNPSTLPLEEREKNHTRARRSGQNCCRSTRGNRPAIASGRRPGRPKLARPESHPPVDDDGYFVGLAISGGGSRSANFSAACMFQLQRLGVLQRVDYISSVSGGSLTAAYYCLTPTTAVEPRRTCSASSPTASPPTRSGQTFLPVELARADVHRRGTAATCWPTRFRSSTCSAAAARGSRSPTCATTARAC